MFLMTWDNLRTFWYSAKNDGSDGGDIVFLSGYSPHSLFYIFIKKILQIRILLKQMYLN